MLKLRHIIMVVGLILIGFNLSKIINRNLTATSVRYAEAVKIDDIITYDKYLSSSNGDAIVYGQISSNDSVSYDELDVKTKQHFICVEKCCEHLVEDIDIDSEGNVDIDWDWEDCRKCSDKRQVNKIQFMGHEYTTSMVDLPKYTLNLKDIGAKTLWKGGDTYIHQSGSYLCGLQLCSDTRYSYKYTPNNLSGCVLVNVSDGRLNFVSDFYGNKSIDTVIAEKESAIGFWSWMIWVIWIPVSILVVCLAEYFIFKRN